MTSLLRQIVAGPRAQHQETGLDLCYVTSNVIATSGPSQTYPQRAYRNPLDQLVAFLDAKHGDDWAIWEFRAEGTGYPDEAVYNRIRHYPWPDHHPPPFRLVPLIMASMRNWLNAGALDGTSREPDLGKSKDGSSRVVVVHCKAGKGRSGTMACSYLISECGWRPEDALRRFTERRMRPNFGAGVSIPSQLRWVGYVDRWTKGGKVYVDREIEVVEVHISGLRHGVKVSIQGFVEDGKKIRVFHTFQRDERHVVEGDAPGGGGMIDLVTDMAGYVISPTKEEELGVAQGSMSHDNIAKTSGNNSGDHGKVDLLFGASSDVFSRIANLKPIRSTSRRIRQARESGLVGRLSPSRSPSSRNINRVTNKDAGSGTLAQSESPLAPSSATSLPVDDGSAGLPKSQASLLATRKKSPPAADEAEPGGQVVVFKPAKPIHLPTSDVNLCLERRNRAPASMGLTMVTAAARLWFNAFFEGQGPERGGRADEGGIFEIEWDAMDGIKGTSQKGTRAAEKVAVVWRAVAATKVEPGTIGEANEEQSATPAREQNEAGTGTTIMEPGPGAPVPQMEPADWKGGNDVDPEAERCLGLRAQDPDSAGVSRASSVKSAELGGVDGAVKAQNESAEDESMQGLRVSGPSGEDELHEVAPLPKPRGEGDLGGGQEPASVADNTAQKGFIIE